MLIQSLKDTLRSIIQVEVDHPPLISLYALLRTISDAIDIESLCFQHVHYTRLLLENVTFTSTVNASQ